MMMVDRSDVLVIGGGPGGSTIAALLAQRGENVVLVEKDTHPRFHIGESLLPMNVPLLEELGVKMAVDRIGMPKFGVEFVSPWHEHVSQQLDFAEAWDKNLSSAYEVRRSEFDDLLFKNAAARGASVIEGCRISRVEFPPEGGVVATGQDSDGQERRFEAKFLVDASGRDTLVAGQLATKERNPRHATAAVYSHYAGAWRRPDKAAGNITLFWFDHGWFWYIPLLDGTTSVGAVCSAAFMKARGTDVTTFFHSLIAQCPPLAARLEGAQMTGPATATGNYSYRSKTMMGPNYILVGDAYAFIDPVFSSGVLMAMKSAFLGADAVSAWLHGSRAEADRALQKFDTAVQRAIDRFSWYIYRVNSRAMRDLFMRPGNPFRMREAVMSLLAGDVYGHSPIGLRLFLFKCVYYLKTLYLPREKKVASWSAPGAGMT